jgi:NADPH:quinone reductase-like Zn-dependent oxidoreductase
VRTDAGAARNGELRTAVHLPEWGGPELLSLATGPVPEPGAAEILVRTHAAGLNPVDWKVRSGVYAAAYDVPFPLVLGRDFSGTVLAAGPDAAGDWQPGDEVVGTLAFEPKLGAYATHLLVTDAALARRSETVAPDQAAALPVGGLTAWQALHEVAEVKPGQKVLVHAGAGGVGHLTVQLAAQAGCAVTATCSPHNADFVRHLGATQAFDYTSGRFEDSLQDFDVVVDCVGGDVLDRSYAVLRPGGIAVTMANRPDPHAAEAAGVRVALVFMRPDAAQLAMLLDKVAEGSLSVHVDASYPMAQVQEAHQVLEQGHVRGKLVLTTRDVPELPPA